MAKIEQQPPGVRQFLRDAERLEARARIAAPGHAGSLIEQANNLRAAAARIAARHRRERGGELDLGEPI